MLYSILYTVQLVYCIARYLIANQAINSIIIWPSKVLFLSVIAKFESIQHGTLYLSSRMHTQNVPRQNVPGTKRPNGLNVQRDKTSQDKTSKGQNVPRDKTPQGTKRPKGQNAPGDKTENKI